MSIRSVSSSVLLNPDSFAVFSIVTRSLSWIAVLILSLLLAACGTSDPPPAASEVLTAMLAAVTDTAQPLPDGVIRLSSAPVDSPDYLTETFLSALYGEAARGLLGEDSTHSRPVQDAALYGEAARGLLGEDSAHSRPVQDAALYLSVSPYPFELGVFRCADGDTAGEVAALCRGRLDTLARGFAESEWREAAAGGRVAVEGNWVLLVLCEDPVPVTEAARRVVG